MHVVLVPFGSHGDVHPFLGLGLKLRSRGRRVTFLINEYFGPLVRDLGFEMEPLGGAELFEQAMQNADLWHPRKAFPLVLKAVHQHAALALPVIDRIKVPGETVLVGGTMAFSTRLAHDAWGLPAATVHLQPAVLFSVCDPPHFPGFETPRWWPRWFRKVFFDVVFSLAVNPHVDPGVNAARANLGLPPVRGAMRDWIHAPQLVLGLFPSWFAPPQPDWPPQTKVVGFPLYDERDATPIPPDLERFLGAGPPPIAFTPGSANLFGRSFFEAAADACARLGRRGVLLTRHAEQVPADLPEGVIHVPFAPFSRLLPRTAALVHHGGIGTSSQGLAAGVPQVVMPLGHDQFDNASRMANLGVARSLLPKHFRGPALAAVLAELLDSPAVAAAGRAVAARVAADPDPLAAACEAIEALAEPATVGA